LSGVSGECFCSVDDTAAIEGLMMTEQTARQPASEDGETPPAFEESLAALEAAVHDLEDGRLGLSAALARYEESVKHLKRCYQLLEAAEQKIELLMSVAEDGTPGTEKFHEGTESGGESVGRRKRARSKSISDSAGPEA
jgi:exodeoxyribonuclease VII small subunit